MPELDLVELRNRGNRAALATASFVQVAASLVALCEKLEAPEMFVDFDKLMSVGIFLDGAGHEHCDAVAIRWLSDRPTFRRLDIVASLLNGLWLPTTRLGRVDGELVAALVAGRRATETSGKGNPDARYGYATAMFRILEDSRASSNVVEMAIGAVTDAIKAGTGDAILDKTLANSGPSRIEKARARMAGTASRIDEFRGLQCEEGPSRYYVVERSRTRAEVVRVRWPSVSERSLMVEYEILDASIGDGEARRLVFDTILVTLFRDSYRGQVDHLRYVNITSKRTVVTRYSAPWGARRSPRRDPDGRRSRT